MSLGPAAAVPQMDFGLQVWTVTRSRVCGPGLDSDSDGVGLGTLNLNRPGATGTQARRAAGTLAAAL